MNSQNFCTKPTCHIEHESRSAHFNLPVRHPSKWSLIREVLFSSPNHTHRYRTLSNRMFKKTIRQLDRGDCE